MATYTIEHVRTYYAGELFAELVSETGIVQFSGALQNIISHCLKNGYTVTNFAEIEAEYRMRFEYRTGA